MDWYRSVFELIDMRSFSNIWFWIALAVLWSSQSHFVLGVPFDMVARARRHGGQAMADLEDLVRINVARRLRIAHVAGIWLSGIAAAALTALAMLGFWYGIQFGQALFLLLAPATLAGYLGLRACHRLQREAPRGDDLCRFLIRHRLQIQVLGMVAIFVTAMWGMWQNMGISALRR